MPLAFIGALKMVVLQLIAKAFWRFYIEEGLKKKTNDDMAKREAKNLTSKYGAGDI